jgi:curli biogenesis system outer membrane secretion channel CsgG
LDFNDVSLTADSVKRPIGKQLAVLLTTEFAKRGDYSVISQRDKEIAEERVKSFKDGKDKSYAAKIGRQLSANLVVFGDIIEYTITTENSGILIKKKVKHDAKVGFTLTLVDVNTNEVKDGVTIEQVISSTDNDWGYVSNSKMLTEEQRISMLTEASKKGVTKAVCELSRLISSESGAKSCDVNADAKVPVKPTDKVDTNKVEANSNGKNCREVKKGGVFGVGATKEIVCDPVPPTVANGNTSSNLPRIANIDGQEIYVKNLPSETKVGTRVIAYQIGKVVKDDVTGEILKQEELKVAELEVVSINGTTFICKIISGTGLTTKSLLKVAK